MAILYDTPVATSISLSSKGCGLPNTVSDYDISSFVSTFQTIIRLCEYACGFLIWLRLGSRRSQSAGFLEDRFSPGRIYIEMATGRHLEFIYDL